MKIHCMNCMEEYDDEYEICPYCGCIRNSETEEIYHIKPETVLNNRYIIGKVVGYGGFGITYKAWDKQMEKTVAIKEFFPSSLVSRAADGIAVHVYSEKNQVEFDKGLFRFLEEGKSTAKFGTHPNIVNVFDLFEENQTAYIIMEFLDGVSLKEYIAMNDGKLDVETTINILLSIIEALKSIHKEKILHRDISPDNIFICIPDKVKLIDFGAARISNNEEKTMSIILKPGYAPPEQYRSKSKQGAWTDIYALAATMYYALTGVVPMESIDRMVKDELVPPNELVPEIPQFISDSLMNAMALNHELRFKNVSEFEEAILQQRKVRTIEDELKKRKTRRNRLIAGIAVMLAVGALVTGLLFHHLKFDAQLEATTITVWVCADGDDKEMAETDFANRISEFKDDYPHIEIEITAFSEAGYYQKLLQAYKQHKLPDLFVTTYADAEILEDTISLNDVFKAIEKNDLYFLSDYTDYFPEKKQMPTGVNISVLYESKISKNAEGSNNLQDFYDGKTPYLQDGTILYDDIQTNMAGKYSIQFQSFDEKDTLNGCFLDAWSVCAYSDEAKRKASERVIAYLLGETGQDYYYIQNGNGTPINKACFSDYISINWELAELDTYMDSLDIKKEHLFSLDTVQYIKKE